MRNPKLTRRLAFGLVALTALTTSFGSKIEFGVANDPNVKSLSSVVSTNAYQTKVYQLSGAAPLPKGRRISDRYEPLNIQAIHEYFTDYFRAIGFQNVHSDHFYLEHREQDGKNFWVEIPGSLYPNEVILVGAHYDSTDTDMPGANDNASGVAGVLEIAAAFKAARVQPERTIRFVIFDAEEDHNQWEAGSEFYLKNAKQNHQESIELFFNMDMIGYSPTGYKHVLFDPGEYRNIKSILKMANESGQLGMGLEQWGEHGSDQKSGWALGIPSVSIFESPRDHDGKEMKDFPHYHTRRDTVDKINFGYATDIVRLVTLATYHASIAQNWNRHIAREKSKRYFDHDQIKQRAQHVEYLKRVNPGRKFEHDWKRK